MTWLRWCGASYALGYVLSWVWSTAALPEWLFLVPQAALILGLVRYIRAVERRAKVMAKQ